MLSSHELQKMSEEAQQKATEARRTAYIKEHAPKPAFLADRYDHISLNILSSSCNGFFNLWPTQLKAILPYAMLALCGLLFLRYWLQSKYREKVRKANEAFEELLSKEELQFHVNSW